MNRTGRDGVTLSNWQSPLTIVHCVLQKLFSNRDYVFNRRYFVDSSRKLIIIVNKSTTHPACPRNPNNQRVKDYWSYMVIRSTSSSFKNPGVEYVLTYFDNPGIVLPPTITSWVAQKQMPEFLNKMHLATVEYAQERKKYEDANVSAATSPSEISTVKLIFRFDLGNHMGPPQGSWLRISARPGI